jgi:class 3 adenylate cyclase
MAWLWPRFAAVFLGAIAAIPSFANLSPESGSFVFQTYSPKAYAANPQNWDIVQDSRGVMYFANTDGVLEFDGVFWRLIPLTYRSAARSLAIDARGRIYVGGRGEFGYLAPDSHGAATFVLIKVPKADSGFFDVWNIVPTSSGVYFGTSFAIYFYSNSGQLTVWRAKARFGRIFSAYGELFATTSDLGMRRLENDDFIAGPVGDAALVRGNVSFAPGERPLLASRQALFDFTLSDIVPFANSASEYLKQNEIYFVKQLSSGDVAVGTKNGGLVLLNRQGGLERIVRKDSALSSGGLPSNWISAIYEDNQHAIWLATDNGLVRFVLNLSTFAEPQGIQGSVNAEARQADTMYVATTRGAFRMRPIPGGEPAFDEVKDLHEQVFVLAEHGGDFFAGGERGLYRVIAGKAEKISATEGVIYDIDIGYSRRDPNLLYTAGLGGVRQWRRAGRTWKSGEPIGVKGQDFLTVVEDADGTIWSTTGVAIWHIDLSATAPRVEQFTSADGIPSGLKYAYLFRGHVVFATEKGLLRFSEKTGRFERDFELGPQYANSTKGVAVIREDSAGNVWITGTGYHDFIENNSAGAARAFSSPLIQANVDVLWTIFLDPDGTCWASDPTGTLIRLAKLDLKQRPQELPVLLRRVSVVGQKESLFEGDVAPRSPLALQYRDNALRFEFAAPFYEAPAALQYQYRLDGDDKKWSDWTPETHKEYTNLFEGAYRFHLRVRDPHGTQSGEVGFPFKVLPPFYRTWWAYASYVFVFLFAGWLILRWRLQALQARNRWLEGVVEERTAEVRKERDQNEELLLNILPRPVATELRTNGSVKPTSFEDATVCFSDFVGFTLSSEKLPAETLINALNEYFTAFDEIIGRYGLEKLKTIGDAYMFAGGLPNLRPSHAVDAVLAALEMAAAVNRLTRPEQGVNWKIRLGLYSGPVVSGVVGVRKFAFDIWGNTVNFAARMESAGQPGRVNLSETTFQRVEGFIECEARGAVPIKEGRRMEMYFACNPKLELLEGPLINGVPAAFFTAYEKAFGEPPRSFPTSETLEELRSTVAEPLVAPSEPK